MALFLTLQYSVYRTGNFQDSLHPILFLYIFPSLYIYFLYILLYG